MPKLIGINAIFEEYRGASDDSLLYLSIKNAGNVILISNLADNRLINSDSAFLEASIAQGLLDYEFNDEKVLAKYRNYISWNNKVLWSFPVTMISYYDIERAEEIMKTTIPNQYYQLGKIEELDSSIIISATSLDSHQCEQFANRIVLLGNLGATQGHPGDQYLVYTDSGIKLVHSTIILAHVIKKLLSGEIEVFNE